VLLVLLLALLLPLAATAAPKPKPKQPGHGKHLGHSKHQPVTPQPAPPAPEPAIDAALSAGLLSEALANPNRTFNVIVQGTDDQRTSEVKKEVASVEEGDGAIETFDVINGVTAGLTGEEIVELAQRGNVLAISEDAQVVLAGASELLNSTLWPFAVGAPHAWIGRDATANLPAIAVVDSGIEAGRADFGGRVVADVNLNSLRPSGRGDDRGHGTFVASIAAGSALGHYGIATRAPIVSLDVIDERGMALTSDVIAAADWIVENKNKHNIRVANFSLHTAKPTTFLFDPLNAAVERLWFNGVVVVTSAGNYAQDGARSDVVFAPGNDPFVITVGAVDINRTARTSDDYVGPWSAYGYTLDGFRKPELSAPGRYMVGAVPMTSTMALERPDKIVAPGYMQMSGTSFAAPVVSGIAAALLGKHPEWTPDQVKGALMLSANHLPRASGWSAGVGEVDLGRALKVATPPNPNLALNAFIATSADGERVFDAASWANAAKADASWANASWANASWANASWANASWANASWANASWANTAFVSASWANQAEADASWANASWANASWANASWANLVNGTASWANSTGGELSPEALVIDLPQLYREELELGLDLDGDEVIGDPAPIIEPLIETPVALDEPDTTDPLLP
jgi:serine protease AprX